MRDFRDINLKLCHSCGTCVAVCPAGCLSMVDGLPKLTKECSACNLCYESCPGIGFHYPEFNKKLFGVSEADAEVGYYRSIYVGHAKDEVVRKRGASGGVVTALLLGLLKRGEIKGAVVVGMDERFPWLSRAKIAVSEREILGAAKSKYSMVPVNELLGSLDAFEGDLAFVGLPCHMHGVRKLEKLGWKNAKKIKYCIGTFCGLNMLPKATDFLLQKANIKTKDIESLEYRGGDWPGGFLVRTKSGRTYFKEKHIYNYLNLMFVPRRCLVCPDLTNEFADISVGDAWNKELGRSGWSTLIVRSAAGQGLMDRAVKGGDIAIKDSDKEKLKEGHSHLVLYKKKGVLFRQNALVMKPVFDLNAPPCTVKEKAFNVIFFYIIRFMQTGVAIGIFKFMPLALPGLLGKQARAAINLMSRPKESAASDKTRQGLFHRIKAEYDFLTLKDWDLSDVGRYWDGVEDYDEINKETYSYFRRFIDGHRLSNLPKNSYVLDICARTGNGTLFFWEKGIVEKSLCADFSRRMQSACVERLKKAGVPFQSQLIESIPFPFKDREFDVVLSFETVEHVPDPAIFIKEVGRVTRTEGQLVLSTPNRLWQPIHSLAAVLNIHHSEGPCRFISRRRMRRYLSDAGFDIVTERTTVLIPAGPRFLIKLGEYLENRIGRGLMNILGLRRIYICRKKRT